MTPKAEYHTYVGLFVWPSYRLTSLGLHSGMFASTLLCLHKAQ